MDTSLRQSLVVITSIAIMGFGSSAFAAKTSQVKCHKVIKTTIQKLDKSLDKAANKRCLIDNRLDAAVAACDGDVDCTAEANSKFGAKKGVQTSKYGAKVNKTIDSGNAKKAKVELQGPCDADLAALPAKYPTEADGSFSIATQLAISSDINSAATECDGN